MTNLACLDRQPFARILSGAKRTEWRFRQRPDPRLEAVAIGEPVLLMERGTKRAIRATVRAVMAFDSPDGVLYGVRLVGVTVTESDERHPQGWQRRNA